MIESLKETDYLLVTSATCVRNKVVAMSEVVSDLLFTWKFGVMGAWETVLVKSFGIVIVPYVLNSISSLAGCCGGYVKGLTEVHIGDISLFPCPLM